MSPSAPANKTARRLPRAFMHAVGILGVASMLVLSAWQFQRLEWKEAMIARAEAAKSQPVIALEALPSPEAIPELEYRAVTITGAFIPNQEFHVGPRYIRGHLGYSVHTPFKIAGNNGVILVNRGWVPAAKKEAAQRPETISGEQQTLQGLLRIPGKARMFTPKNQPEKNFWLWVDIPTMQTKAGVALQPWVLEVTGNPQDDVPVLERALPVPSDGAIDFRNDHLGYGITWALLALTIGVMYAYWLRKNPA